METKSKYDERDLIKSIVAKQENALLENFLRSQQAASRLASQTKIAKLAEMGNLSIKLWSHFCA